MTARQRDELINRDCYRKACKQPGASWYNSSTRQYYCRSCALKINEFNPGLCVEEKLK
jgi:hypothetical protein